MIRLFWNVVAPNFIINRASNNEAYLDSGSLIKSFEVT